MPSRGILPRPLPPAPRLGLPDDLEEDVLQGDRRPGQLTEEPAPIARQPVHRLAGIPAPPRLDGEAQVPVRRRSPALRNGLAARPLDLGNPLQRALDRLRLSL